MGLTPFDVSNLNRSIEGVGNVFAEKRREAMEQQHLDIQDELRQRMLDAEMRRTTAEEGRQNLLSQGQVAATLQDDDGNQVTYQGPASGYQGFLQNSAAQGKNWTPVKQPKRTPYSAQINTEDGFFRADFDDPDQMETWLAQIKKAHKTLPQQQSGQYGPIQADKYAQQILQEGEQAAQAKEAQAASVGPGGTDTAQQLLSEAQQLRQDAKTRAQQVTVGRDPTQFETVTQRTDPVTGQPVTSTVRKVPVGAAATPSEADVAATQMPNTGPVRVSSKAQRDALAKGTRYIGPDGKAYIKQ